jgi:ABC-type transport system involved in multi-copper enzyme maturation permease subunit
VSKRRVRAIVRKELREYRHNGNIVYAMSILPLVFLIQPLIQVFTLSSSASVPLQHEHSLLYMLAIPVLVPAVLAAYSVVGERLQGTLEPVLASPIRREELLLGKALSAFVPSVAVAYAVFGLFVAVVELFAQPAVASALIQGPDLLAQLCSPRSSPLGPSGWASPYRPGRATREPQRRSPSFCAFRPWRSPRS